MKPYRRWDKAGRVVWGVVALATALGFVLVGVQLGVRAEEPLGGIAAVASAIPYREAQQPAISFIDSPDATCYRPTAGTGACYIEWRNLSVQAAPSSYIISMTVAIDGQLRAYHSGFFQQSMFIPAAMSAPGYKVACGALGSGGSAQWGATYSYAIRASETGGQTAANYGSVTCPADEVVVFLPLVRR